jgi:predicted hydrocarbon binding protein
LKEDLVERLFLASLWKALQDIAPERLEVFQKWFDPADRRPRFHIAPVMGAVSYLRRDTALYQRVMEQAGRYAADWSFEHLSPLERKLWGSLPRAGRDRAVRRLLRVGLKNIHSDGELEARREGPKLVVTVSNSIFRRTVSGNGPVCLYYGSLFAGLMERAALRWSLVVESSCGGQGRPECLFEATA